MSIVSIILGSVWRAILRFLGREFCMSYRNLFLLGVRP